jgi:hypothetical protein
MVGGMLSHASTKRSRCLCRTIAAAAGVLWPSVIYRRAKAQGGARAGARLFARAIFGSLCCSFSLITRGTKRTGHSSSHTGSGQGQ